MSRCQHLCASEEAYMVNADTGEEVPATRYLCEWLDAHPERLVNAPRWLTNWGLSGGPNFDPQTDCPGCPGYAPPLAEQ